MEPKAIKKRLAQLRDIEELRLDAFWRSSTRRKLRNGMIKESRTKFKVVDKVLLFNTRVKLFPVKLVFRWSGPFKIIEVTHFDAVRLKAERYDFLVNLQNNPLKSKFILFIAFFVEKFFKMKTDLFFPLKM